MSNHTLLRRLAGSALSEEQPVVADSPAHEGLLQKRVDAVLIQDPASQLQYERLRENVRDQLLQEISGDLLLKPSDTGLRLLARERITAILERDGSVPAMLRETVVTRLVQDLVGFGVIQPLIDDPTISEILVNRYNDIWAERGGKLERVKGIAFESDQAVRHLAERIAQPIRRRIDERHPLLEARLSDGSRICATLSPPALDGCAMAIRKFNPRMLGWRGLVDAGTLDEATVSFLRRTVRARCNILVVGGTSSGKTTVLNALSAFIPDDERVITIEDAAELQLQQPHLLRYETRQGNAEGQGAITIRDLVRTALRLRPDRIVVGEVRGPEALDMIQACNTGHDGCFSTLHANTAQDGLARLETMVLMADSGLPIRAIRQQVSAAFELVIHCARLRSGERRVVEIAEVELDPGAEYRLRSLYRWSPGVDRLEPSGVGPVRINQRYLWHEEG